MNAGIEIVPLSWQDGANIIVGQSHFIKTAEDLAEVMANTAPSAKYGLAFNEASGPCLVRTEANDEALVADAVRAATAVGAGHTFYLVVKGIFPVAILNQVKSCPEVCRVYCATGNPLQVLVATTPEGRGIIGVIDGSSPKGVEGAQDRAERRAMLRRFGYKF